jgi:hypothetical protein
MAADQKSTLKLFFDCKFHTLHTRVPTQKLNEVCVYVRWFTADLIVHWVRHVFFLALSGISCVTILKYTLILSPQFRKTTENYNNVHYCPFDPSEVIRVGSMCAEPLCHRNVNIKLYINQIYVNTIIHRFCSSPQWNFMCYYTKVYFNIIPTIQKNYRKQNKQPKRKLVRQIILEINSLDM